MTTRRLNYIVKSESPERSSQDISQGGQEPESGRNFKLMIGQYKHIQSRTDTNGVGVKWWQIRPESRSRKGRGD